jgi:CMP-N,N'-diacetyllegionaminic acid synthase
MIDGKTILAVVPARGGSKGIPMKNLRLVGGVPLVARAGSVATSLEIIDCAVVSTDNEEIARVAESSGLRAPFRRPIELSGDRIGDIDVLRHALFAMEKIDKVQYDIVLMLQPTSPLRTHEHVRDTILKLNSGKWDAVWTVSETDSKSHPLKQLTLSSLDQLGYFDIEGGGRIIARQQLTPVFHRNGCAYAFTRECLLSQNTIMGGRTSALVLHGDFVSIDTEYDIELVEWIMKRNQHKTGLDI